MAKTYYEAAKNQTYVSNREFVCGLVEVIGNRIKLNVNSEFLTISASGFSGIIPLDSGDDAASIDKMRAAAEYFAELAQALNWHKPSGRPQSYINPGNPRQPRRSRQRPSLEINNSRRNTSK